MGKILIVEDHPDTREILRMMLELDKHEIVEARAGEEGVSKAKEFGPDLILMDISLAGEINGWEATRRLRADPQFDNTIIVALTAHAMKEDRERSFAHGCDDYWTKPIIDFEEFQRSIIRLVARGRRAAETNGKSSENGIGPKLEA
jgi:CheY-like chemotaxis protein